MTEYQDQSTRIGGSTSNRTSPGKGNVHLRLSLGYDSEGLVLNLQHVYYLPSSPCNLLSLGLLNNSGIFHDNENEILYHLGTKKVPAQAKQWRNSYPLKTLNLSDAAVLLLKIDDKTYQWPTKALHTTLPHSLPITTWHKRLGHMKFLTLKTYLYSVGYVCDSCQQVKAAKIYSREPQKTAERPYQLIHTDLVGPINLVGFTGERYFFTFTDDATRYTETYTTSKKSEWLKCLKTYHSLCKTKSKQEHPIERLRSDYGSELQNHKADNWMQKEGIVFEPSAPYSQEQNGVAEQTGRSLMDMTRAILEGNIDNDLWPEVILSMTYIKNNRPTRALCANPTPQEAQNTGAPNLFSSTYTY